MAIRTVYNRDGSVYGEIDTDKYIFDNNAITSTPIQLNPRVYPYVKIDGEYYYNDGLEWSSKTRAGNSGSMMPKTKAYLWDDGRDILQGLDLPVEFVKSIDVDNLKERELLTSDIVDKHNCTVQYQYLNLYGRKHTIPRYFYNTDENVKGFSFIHNIDHLSNNAKSDGLYTFDEDLTSIKKDTKYWSFYPCIYPIVVFNSTNSFNDTKSLNVKKTNTSLTIGTNTYALNEDDVVILYTRDSGTWTPASPPDTNNKEVESSSQYMMKLFPFFTAPMTTDESIKEFDAYSNTGVLNCEPIKIWQLKDNVNFTLKLQDANATDSIGNNAQILNQPHPLYTKIVQKLADQTFNLPSLKGVSDHSSVGNFYVNFGVYGKQSKTPKSHVNLSMSCTIKNLELVSYQNEDIPSWFSCVSNDNNSKTETKTNGDIRCNINSLKDTGAPIDAYLYGDFSCVPGLFPKQMAYFGDASCEDYIGFINYPNPWNQTFKGKTTASDMNFYSYAHYHSELWLLVVPVIEDYYFAINWKIGYINKLNSDTFGLAVAIFRNGKLIN